MYLVEKEEKGRGGGGGDSAAVAVAATATATAAISFFLPPLLHQVFKIHMCMYLLLLMLRPLLRVYTRTGASVTAIQIIHSFFPFAEAEKTRPSLAVAKEGRVYVARAVL